MTQLGFFGNMPYLVRLPSCLCYLRTTGISNGTVFRDWSSNHITFTNIGSPTNSTTQSKFGPCSMRFDGSSYLVGSSRPNVGGHTSPMTLSFWVYIPVDVIAAETYNIIASSVGSVNPTNGDWLIFIRGTSANYGMIYFERYTGSGGESYKINTSSGTFIAGQWNHIIVSYTSNTSCKLSLNGVETTTILSASYTPTGGPYGFLIGNGINSSSSPNYLIGYLDEVGIWNTALPTSILYPQTRRMIVG